MYLGTSGVPNRRKSNAPGRNRTCDQRFRKPLLYPLSYEGGNCSIGLAARLSELGECRRGHAALAPVQLTGRQASILHDTRIPQF
jgi:hypothetical protein